MLHLTRIAFGCTSLEMLAERVNARTENGQIFLSTRYKPKRADELIGGSLFWIVRHQLVARQVIMEFDDEAEPGRCRILLEATLTSVLPIPKRAHQGWRYLADGDAPRDLNDGEAGGDTLPSDLAGELAGLSLI
jgi:hypothetical protein